jgi:hypothetical protein
MKNGVPFTPDGVRTQQLPRSLLFSSIMPDDSGRYTCIVGDNQDAENIIVDVIFHGMYFMFQLFPVEENNQNFIFIINFVVVLCG